MITKVLVGAAIALGAALGAAAPAGADPSSFGILGCSCRPSVAGPDGKVAVKDQIDQGIQNGLGYPGGTPQRPSNS